jgi:YbbR domain-containing protein
MAGLIRRIFFQNMLLKVLSMLLAVALFLLAREDRVKETEIDIPVIVGKVGELTVFTGDAPRSIRVRLQGRWSRLLRVLESRLEPYMVDLEGYQDGSVYPFDVNKIEQIVGVPGLEIVSVFPPSMVVHTEPRVSKVVPVIPDLVGEPDTGYLIEERQIRLNPSSIEVSGARSDLADIESVRTTPIDLTGISSTLEMDVAVRPPPGRRIWLDPERIEVVIPVSQRIVSDELVAVPINVVNCPSEARCAVEPTHVRVRVSGPLLDLRALKTLGEENMVLVDARRASREQGRHEDLPIEVKRVENLTMQVIPDRATLFVEVPEPPPLPPPLPPLDADAGAHAPDAGERDAGPKDQ